MSALKSEFLQIMSDRGFLHQATDLEGLDNAFQQKENITAYIGFDCTAPSLHVGSLLQIMLLRWLQKCGHRPLVLMGGGTTKIGDPTDRDESRKILSNEQITQNMEGIRKNFGAFLTFGNQTNDAMFVDNAEWLDSFKYIEFLRTIGNHFSINRMIKQKSVQLRMERDQELSFLEFNYMILQAYDFLELNKRFGCILQIGGSDQWGNIVNGIELHRRVDAYHNPQHKENYSSIYGFTTPLISTSSGIKMGKTAAGAVWLDPHQFSPSDYWQFWRNTEDADVGRFLKFFTELPLSEIKRLETLQGAEINEAKKILANEATRLCHGIQEAEKASEIALKTFEERGASDNLKSITLHKAAIAEGIPAYELFFMAGLKESKGESRKLIEGGGAKINNEKVLDPKMLVTLDYASEHCTIKLSAGKKNHILVRIAE